MEMLKLSTLKSNAKDETDLFNHYCYILVKKNDAMKKCNLVWPELEKKLLAFESELSSSNDE